MPQPHVVDLQPDSVSVSNLLRRQLLAHPTLALATVLVAATAFLYLPSLRNQFVNYDDPAYVLRNTHVLQGLSWKNIAWALSSTAEANWHPLTWLSHMADVQLFRLNPAGHHFANLLLHVCNVLLLFLLLRAATSSALSSAVVAALFAVHPLNVESVAWVAERKSLLSTFFMFLAFWAWGGFLRDRSIARYAVTASLFALSLMAKPMTITFPFLLLLADYWPLCRARRNNVVEDPVSMLFVEKIPLFAMSALSAAVTVYAQHAGGALGTTAALPFKWRIENAIYSYAVYLFKAVWPSKLAVFYPHPEGSLGLWKVILAGALVLAITGLFYFHRRRRYLIVGWLWFLGTLFPVIGIVQVGRQGWADRYAYIPLIGIFVVLMWLGSELLQRAHISRQLAGTAVVAMIVGYASISYRQIHYWHDSYTLFSRALEVTTNNSIAEDNLGEALVELGHPELAIPHFRAAVRISPTTATPYYNLGTLFQMQDRLEEAKRQYLSALQYSSDSQELAQTHNNLGALLMRTGNLPEAKSHFDAALAIDPNKVNSLLGRGMVEYRQNALDGALEDFIRASAVDPSPLASFWIGRVLEDKGRSREAAISYEQALRMSPNLHEAQERLDVLRSRLDR